MASPLCEIIENLYIANYYGATVSPKNCYIVNCTANLPMVREQGIQFNLDENGTPESIQRMLDALHEAVPKIQHQISYNVPVVVYCHSGLQRSPTIVAGYLMKYHEYTLDDAVEFIKSKKEDAFHKIVRFRKSLTQYIN
jgi:hypothetical protein